MPWRKSSSSHQNTNNSLLKDVPLKSSAKHFSKGKKSKKINVSRSELEAWVWVSRFNGLIFVLGSDNADSLFLYLTPSKELMWNLLFVAFSSGKWRVLISELFSPLSLALPCDLGGFLESFPGCTFTAHNLGLFTGASCFLARSMMSHSAEAWGQYRSVCPTLPWPGKHS